MKTLLTFSATAIVAMASSHAATLISDSFGGMADNEGLTGRTPEISNAGGAWNGSTANLISNGAGALEVGYTTDQPRTASINLGAGYLAANPGPTSSRSTSPTPPAPPPTPHGWGSGS